MNRILAGTCKKYDYDGFRVWLNEYDIEFCLSYDLRDKMVLFYGSEMAYNKIQSTKIISTVIIEVDENNVILDILID